MLSCFLRLFDTIDENKDKQVERKELRLALAVAFVGGDGNQAEMSSNQIMEEYDVNHDEQITLDEFLNGLRKWSIEMNQEKLNQVSFTFKSFFSFVFCFVSIKFIQINMVGSLLSQKILSAIFILDYTHSGSDLSG